MRKNLNVSGLVQDLYVSVVIYLKIILSKYLKAKGIYQSHNLKPNKKNQNRMSFKKVSMY